MKEPLILGFRVLIVSILGVLLVLLWILGFQSYKQGHPGASVMCGIMMVIIIKKMLNVLFEKNSDDTDKHSLGYQ